MENGRRGICWVNNNYRNIIYIIRYKMYAGSLCVLGAFPFIFTPCVDCEHSPKSDQMFYFSVFVVIFQFGWACVQISHLSLIPELTPNEHDRTRLTAIRYLVMKLMLNRYNDITNSGFSQI